MNELEKRLYKIMDKVGQEGLPIVFKGAMITNLVLRSKGYKEIIRSTSDIDANWVGKNKPSMEYLEKIINDIIKKVDPELKVKAWREYGDNQSAGFKVISENDDTFITSIDLDIKHVPEIQKYWYGDMRFQGVTVNQIMCDKLSVLSGEQLFRRVKDMVDIYALSQCVKIKTQDIYKIADSTNRKISSFEKFLSENDKLEHAYQRLTITVGKPEFNQIYNYLKKFIIPFKNGCKENMVWSCKSVEWKNIKEHEIIKSNHRMRELER